MKYSMPEGHVFCPWCSPRYPENIGPMSNKLIMDKLVTMPRAEHLKHLREQHPDVKIKQGRT